MSSFMRFLNINTQLTPSAVVGSTSKQVLLCGQRTTNGTLTLATNGFAQPNYYIPLLLPSFSDGVAALIYLKNYGIKSSMGINFSLTLPAPTAVISSNSLTTLTWASIPSGFSQLTGFALTGTLSQSSPGSLSATVYSAQIISGVATLIVYGTVAFVDSGDSGGVLTLAGVNNINYPDPNATDPIALMVWDFYQSSLSAFKSPNGVPAAYISILSDRDTTINPVSTGIVLGDPSAVTTGATSTLTYATSTAGLGYLPTTTLGASTVTQATSAATGTFAGYIVDGSNVIITVTNVTGTFDTSHAVTVSLDNTVNAFGYLDGINLYSSVLQFPILSLTSITTTYADFYNGINLINQPNQVLNQHFFTYGIGGNVTSLPSAAAALPHPNNQEYILVTYPYVAQFGDVPYENTAGNVAAGRIASAVAYMLANGDAPYPPLMTATINHLPVSSLSATTSYSGAQNGSGDIAVGEGWLPLAPNSSGVVSFLESVTTLITIPNTSTPDVEFRYTHIWDCVRYLKQQVAQLFSIISVLPNNQGSALISPSFTRQFTQGIYQILYTGQNLGIVENVALYQNLVTVTQDQTNPNQVDVYIPAQIIPQLNGANVLINVFSSLNTFSQGA